MNERDFVFWLDGFIRGKETSVGERSSEQLTGITLEPKQVMRIQEKLKETIDRIKE